MDITWNILILKGKFPNWTHQIKGGAVEAGGGGGAEAEGGEEQEEAAQQSYLGQHQVPWINNS